ncbi:MAG: hypothetical protein IK031_07505 [Bacteroidales bacterium]|nr:hypothetical protein [Bacteroidales bacterium]
MRPSLFILMLLLASQVASGRVDGGCFTQETVAARGFHEGRQLPETASGDDRSLITGKSFSDKLIEEKAPEGANAIERAAWKVSRQLTGKDFYRPVNYMFFRQAVKEIGLIPAIFATADRILRDSKIGTYDIGLDAAHPLVEEGPEAYAPGRAGK